MDERDLGLVTRAYSEICILSFVPLNLNMPEFAFPVGHDVTALIGCKALALAPFVIARNGDLAIFHGIRRTWASLLCGFRLKPARDSDAKPATIPA